MIECDLILHLLFVVQVEDNVVVLDGGNVWEVDAGKRVVALGAFLFTAGSGNDLAVKDDVDAMGFLAACKEETVGQVGLGIGNLQVNGFLGTGDDNRFWRILDQVGESGCGKSTFVRMVISLDKPTSGEILYHGKNLADLSKKETWLNRQNMQMVFQDPLASFDPKMKIVDILTEPLINFGKLKKSEKEAKARELLEMVELPGDFVDRYPHNMSGGQRQRISIARALSLEPEILVCDEATSALDVSVQESVIELLVRLQKEKNISMLFICHDLALIRSFAHQIAVMYLGNIVEVIPGEDVTEHAVHPYTQALLGAQFSIHMDPSQKIQSIESEAPSPLDVPKGCPFQNRCEHCTDRCKAEMPKLKEIAPGHEAACFYVEEHLKN